MAIEQRTCSRVTVEENFRVHVTSTYRYRTQNVEQQTRWDKETCDEMHEQIRRHVDGVGDVTTECDTRHECSKCGHEWEPEPGCDDPSVMECSHCGRAVREEGSDG